MILGQTIDHLLVLLASTGVVVFGMRVVKYKGGNMLLQHTVKPISYVKAHAADIIREIADRQSIVVITQKGEAKAVLQDIGGDERL